MITRLETFLNSIVSPEYKELLLRTYTTLIDAGVDGHADEIEQAIMDKGDERDTCLEWVIQILTNVLVSTIHEFGVVISPDLKIGNIILNALANQIDDYADYSRLDAILMYEQDDIDTLVDILAEVTDLDPEDFLPVIQHVAVDLIDRIDNVLGSKIESPLQDQSLLRDVVHRFNEWRKVYRGQGPIFATTALENGARFGTPVDMAISGDANHIYEMSDLKQKGMQVLGFILMSDTPELDIPKVHSRLLEQLGVAPFDMLEASIPLREYMDLTKPSGTESTDE